MTEFGPVVDGEGEPEPKLTQYRAMRDEMQAQRDSEMYLVNELRALADSHDRTVTSLNERINHMWQVISDLEQS